MSIVPFHNHSIEASRDVVLVLSTLDLIISVCSSVAACYAVSKSMEETRLEDRDSNPEPGEKIDFGCSSGLLFEVIDCILSIVGTLCTTVLLIGVLKMSLITCKFWIGMFLALCMFAIISSISQAGGPKCSFGYFLIIVLMHAFNFYMLLWVIKFVQNLEKSNYLDV